MEIRLTVHVGGVYGRRPTTALAPAKDAGCRNRSLSDGLLLCLALRILSIAKAGQFLSRFGNISKQTVGPLQRVLERTVQDIVLKYVARILGVFFEKSINIGMIGCPVGYNLVSKNAGIPDVSLKNEPVDGMSWINRDGIVSNVKIGKVSVSADDQTIGLRMNHLVMGNHDPAIFPAIDVEAVGGLDSLIVVKFNIGHTPAPISNVITDDLVVANLPLAASDYDCSTAASGPMVHCDVFDEVSLIVWIGPRRADSDGEIFGLFPGGIHDMNVVDPLVSAI